MEQYKKQYEYLMLRIFKGGNFGNIKKGLEKLFFIENNSLIKETLPPVLTIKFEHLNDNGKVVVINNLLYELFGIQDEPITITHFLFFDWEKDGLIGVNLEEEESRIIENEIKKWESIIDYNNEEPFYNNPNGMIVECYELFKKLIENGVNDIILRNKILYDIVNALKETISFNNNYLKNNDKKDDIYILTEKLNNSYVPILEMIKENFGSYLNIVFDTPKTSSINSPNILLEKTVFGNKKDIIIDLYNILIQYKFLDKDTSDTLFYSSFLINWENEGNEKVILKGSNLSDIACLIESLGRVFEEKYYTDKGFFNSFWSERFLFITEKDKFSIKTKTKNDISKMISSYKNEDRTPKMKNTIQEIMKHLQ